MPGLEPFPNGSFGFAAELCTLQAFLELPRSAPERAGGKKAALELIFFNGVLLFNYFLQEKKNLLNA